MKRAGVSFLLAASVVAACQAPVVPESRPGSERPPVDTDGSGTVVVPTTVATGPAPSTRVTASPASLPAPTNVLEAVANYVPPPNSAAIMGKLKSGPASVIADPGTSAAEAPSLLTRSFALQSLEEAPVAAAEVRLVDINGEPLTPQIAKTDTQGQFTLYRPPGLEEALVQALFTAGTTTVEYLAVAPEAGSLDVDTATTLATARWREARKLGARPKPPAPTLLAELRRVLEPGRLPFMGKGSRDVADAFDQFVLDQPRLREKLAAEGPDLLPPLRGWDSAAWHSETSLRQQGAWVEQRAVPSSQPNFFGVDGEGRLHLVVAQSKGPAAIQVVEGQSPVTRVLRLPDTTRAPYALSFSPSKVLHVVCRDATGRWLTFRWENENWKPLFTGKTAPRLSALLKAPAVAANDAGDVYLCFGAQHVIAVARAQADSLQVLAGEAGSAGFADGDSTAARFNRPQAVAVDAAGTLFVADTGNGAIRRVTAKGQVTTVVGQPGNSRQETGEARSGRGKFARLGQPSGLAIAPDGTLFTSDPLSRRVFRISPQGSVFLVAGSGEPGVQEGPGREARFEQPRQLALDLAGVLYVADITPTGTFALRKLQPNAQNRPEPPPPPKPPAVSRRVSRVR